MSSLLIFFLVVVLMIVRDIYHHVEQIKIFVVYDFLADYEDFLKIHDMKPKKQNKIKLRNFTFPPRDDPTLLF